MGGALATLRAVRVRDVGVVPDGVDLAVAAALPAAGVTALRAVRRFGSLLGRRVLVTGASGGVGRYAVQLAALAGAEVVAHVGSVGRGAGLGDLSAAEVVTDLAGVAPVHGVVENVGGPLLGAALALVAEDGVALSVGQASGQPTTIDFEAERRRGCRRRVEVFGVGAGYAGFGADIEELLGLVAAGRLDPQIGWRGSWERAAEAADALHGRRVAGKAVVEIGEV
jgi:NADPH:quinone reductase